MWGSISLTAAGGGVFCLLGRRTCVWTASISRAAVPSLAAAVSSRMRSLDFIEQLLGATGSHADVLTSIRLCPTPQCGASPMLRPRRLRCHPRPPVFAITAAGMRLRRLPSPTASSRTRHRPFPHHTLPPCRCAWALSYGSIAIAVRATQYSVGSAGPSPPDTPQGTNCSPRFGPRKVLHRFHTLTARSAVARAHHFADMSPPSFLPLL